MAVETSGSIKLVLMISDISGVEERSGIVGVRSEVGVQFKGSGFPVGGGDGGFRVGEIWVDAWGLITLLRSLSPGVLRCLRLRENESGRAGKNTQDDEKTHRYLNTSLAADYQTDWAPGTTQERGCARAEIELTETIDCIVYGC